MDSAPELASPQDTWYFNRDGEDLGAVSQHIGLFVFDEVNVVQEVVGLFFRQNVCKTLEGKELLRCASKESLNVLGNNTDKEATAALWIILKRNQKTKSLHSARYVDRLVLAAL